MTKQSGCSAKSWPYNPRSVEALNSRALAYLARARPGDAALGVDDLERALTIEPQRAATSLNLAVAYMERGADGDVDRAIVSLSEALEMQEDYASAYVNRAGAYVARGSATDLERAFDDLEKALDIEPQLPSAYLVHGNAYLARGHNGDLQLAINEFSHAIDLSPDWPQPYFNRGLVHSQLGTTGTSLCPICNALKNSAPAKSHTTVPFACNSRSRDRLVLRCPTATRRWLATSPASLATAAAWPTPLQAGQAPPSRTSRSFCLGWMPRPKKAAAPTIAPVAKRGFKRSRQEQTPSTPKPSWDCGPHPFR